MTSHLQHRRSGGGEPDWVPLLRRAGLGEVDATLRRRLEYSSDASNYRVVPAAVAFPRDADEVAAAVTVCREAAVPVTARGAGTSVAGNAIGPGLVLDLSRHLNRIEEVDPEAGSARVQPGVVLDRLQRRLRPHGMRFGPDPATHSRCTLGGMIGNNACGARALRYGRTLENTLALDVVDGTGRRFTAGTDLTVVPGLAEVVQEHQAAIRGHLGRFARQGSGYPLEQLLPEHGHHLGRALVGTEGSCAVVVGARLALTRAPAATALVVLGLPDLVEAARLAPLLLEHAPTAVEALDARLVAAVRQARGAAAVPRLPPGGAWLLVEVAGENAAAALAAASALRRSLPRLPALVLPAGEHAAALWRIREDGAGLASRLPSGAPAWPGWEDAAVPPERLGDYLRDFTALLAEHALDGLVFGHFGDGCVHVRLDLPLAQRPERLRPFLDDAARLVAGHGGSLSGEHGDGRARSQLLPLLYPPQVLRAFARVKACLDPDAILNPGVVVEPDPVDAQLRLPLARPVPTPGGFAFTTDGGSFGAAVHRCVGVGRCRGGDDGVMCPSYRATGDEKDSTRARARVLQELANGLAMPSGWRSAQLRQSLELCLGCKACARECPAGVDVARYRAQVWHQRYRWRPRPWHHYTLGWLPRWLRLAGRAPAVLNRLAGGAATGRVLRFAAGIDPRRTLPPVAADRLGEPLLRRWLATVPPRRSGDPAPAGEVVLWVDSFTRAFAPDVAVAAARLLGDAGLVVRLPPRPVCCGLTWVSTGQLDAARRRMRRTVAVLAPYAARGVPIVGLEPSCVATLRDDLPQLLAGAAGAAAVAGGVRTLAEQLTASGWSPPSLAGRPIVAQPHCHHRSVLGWEADERLLRQAGARLERLDGCCGLAGDFGMRRGRYEVSVAVAERELLPALRGADPGAVTFLADGFSCRTQAEQLAGWSGVHLAELFAAALPDRSG